MAELSKELELITTQLSEKLEKLESEFQRWTGYKTDYDALEKQLLTLPDNTTKSAMVKRMNSAKMSIILTYDFSLLDSYGKTGIYAW